MGRVRVGGRERRVREERERSFREKNERIQKEMDVGEKEATSRDVGRPHYQGTSLCNALL